MFSLTIAKIKTGVLWATWLTWSTIAIKHKLYAELKLYQKFRFTDCKATLPSIQKSGYVHVLLLKSCPEFWFLNFCSLTNILTKVPIFLKDETINSLKKSVKNHSADMQYSMQYIMGEIYRKISLFMQIYFCFLYFLFFMRKEISKFVPTIKQIIGFQ